MALSAGWSLPRGGQLLGTREKSLEIHCSGWDIYQQSIPPSLDGDHWTNTKSGLSGIEFLILASLPKLVRSIQISWPFFWAVELFVSRSEASSCFSWWADIWHNAFVIMLRKTDLRLVTIIIIMSGFHSVYSWVWGRMGISRRVGNPTQVPASVDSKASCWGWPWAEVPLIAVAVTHFCGALRFSYSLRVFVNIWTPLCWPSSHGNGIQH